MKDYLHIQSEDSKLCKRMIATKPVDSFAAAYNSLAGSGLQDS